MDMHKPSSVTLPPLTAGHHQRRLDLVAIIATFGGLLFGYHRCDQRRPGADEGGPGVDRETATGEGLIEQVDARAFNLGVPGWIS